jgi:PAS domain S-box-containing protein
MPRARKINASPLEQRIGRALLGGRDNEGVIAVEGGRVVACSAYAAELLGIEADQVQGEPVARLVLALDGDLLQLHLQSALLAESAVEFVVERPRHDDEWIEVRSLPLSPGVAFMVKDVTERELSELAIRRKEQRLRAANRSLRLAHAAARAASWEWRIGKPLRWLDLPAAQELDSLPTSWTEDEEIADWRSLMPPAGQRAFDRAMTTLASDGVASFELEVTGADAVRHWMRIDLAVTERDSGGEPLRVSGLTVDVTATRRAGEALRAEVAQRKRSEERQKLLVDELNHRVKNMLTTVQSVARQSLGTAKGVAGEFENRLMALAWAYEILTREHWAGASLREVIERTLAPHARPGSDRFLMEGPDLWLKPNRALSFALAFHELATNAVKYGALSNDAGRVQVRWGVHHDAQGRRLEIEWSEEGGPPVVRPPKRGFGSRLIERSLARELGGAVSLDFAPTGLRCHIVAPEAQEEANLPVDEE